MSHNFGTYSIKIIAELISDIIFFPLWWYSRGLLMVVEKILNFLKNREKSLALMIWVKNVFRPMYGQRDWQGYLISIFIRIIQIIFRGFIMMIFVVISIVLLLIWIILPVLVIYEIIFQII